MLLEGQLTKVSDGLELSLEVSDWPDDSSDDSSDDSPDDSPDDEDAPPPPPPPLQEITRRLKIKTIRKKRSFFIFFT